MAHRVLDGAVWVALLCLCDFCHGRGRSAQGRDNIAKTTSHNRQSCIAPLRADSRASVTIEEAEKSSVITKRAGYAQVMRKGKTHQTKEYLCTHCTGLPWDHKGKYAECMVPSGVYAIDESRRTTRGVRGSFDPDSFTTWNSNEEGKNKYAKGDDILEHTTKHVVPTLTQRRSSSAYGSFMNSRRTAQTREGRRTSTRRRSRARWRAANTPRFCSFQIMQQVR